MATYIDKEELNKIFNNTYINKGKLLEELKKDKENDCNYYNSFYDKYIRDEKYEFAIDVITEASAEDVAPVIYAEWIKHTYRENNGCDCWGRLEYDDITKYVCSHCNSWVKTDTIKGYKFCPNCGARMKER